MKLCALCLKNNANKKNTHYLTDAIIRSALNEDGKSKRAYGLTYEVNNSSPFIDFNFQQNTTAKSIVNALGRPANDNEIKKSKDNTAFSVDNVFCDKCEDKFTAIENKFIDKILPKFRNSNISSITELKLTNAKLVRLFFLLQVWRSSVCDEIFKIADESSQKIRLIILDSIDSDVDIINKFPLSITYLVTDEGDIPNMVGFTSYRNPHIICMNDFLVQFYDNPESLKFDELYGINEKENYDYFVNRNENEFTVKIISNEKRLSFLNKFRRHIQDEQLDIIQLFNDEWKNTYGEIPSKDVQEDFFREFIKDLENIPTAQKMSEDRFLVFIKNFINSNN